VYFNPAIQINQLIEYPDCRTNLIGGGGNTDVCPGQQTPSRRHWSTLLFLCFSVYMDYLCDIA